MLCGGVNTARTGRCADLWDAYSSCTAPLPQWGSHTGQQRAHRACNCSQRSSRHHSRHHSRLAARSSRATVPGVDATHDRTCSTSYRGGLVAPLPTISNVAAAAAAAAVLLTCQPVLATPQQQQPWQQQPVCPVTDVAALFGGGEEVERDPVEVRAGCGCRLWVRGCGCRSARSCACHWRSGRLSRLVPAQLTPPSALALPTWTCQPFSLFGTTFKKYVIEKLQGEKASRGSGCTPHACLPPPPQQPTRCFGHHPSHPLLTIRRCCPGGGASQWRRA